MKSRFALLSILLAIPFVLCAQNWDYIRSSGEYYYGVGYGATVAEATKNGMAEVMNMISVNVADDFTMLSESDNENGNIEHKELIVRSLSCISQASLTNVERWVIEDEEPNCAVRCFIRRDELARIYESRIDRAQNYIVLAEEALQKRKLSMALQYYYWSYALICSLQYPNEVKDGQGRLLITEIPARMRDVLSGVKVEIVKREGVYLELLFKYNDEPVSSIGFNFNDGRGISDMDAKDGIGYMELSPDFDKEYIHIGIEYEYKELARGDAEMNSILSVIAKKSFREANYTLKTPVDNEVVIEETKLKQALDMAVNGSVRFDVNPSSTQVMANANDYKAVMDKVIAAVESGNYQSATEYFTIDGLEVFNELIAYGNGRVVGVPDVNIFKSTDGRAVARGLQMAFSFKRGTKKMFVEDVVFTFNKEGKIENVAFGLGKDSTNDIMCKQATGWDDMTKEMVMEFLENYKTAYCLKRLNYIETIFSDDAIIITGNVVKRKETPVMNERQVSIEGNEIITYNRQTKKEYIDRLRNVFRRNEFINIHFTNNEVQWLEKFKDEKVYAIRLGQEYNSTSYADMGYLFLLVDMTNREEPLIKIRTWQPSEITLDEWYNAGDFY